MLCHRKQRLHVAAIVLRILWLVPQFPISDAGSGMGSNRRHVVIPVAQIGRRGTLSGLVGTGSLRVRGRPARRSSKCVNDIGAPRLVQLEEGIQVLKLVHAGGGVDVRPVEHRKRVPGPRSSVAQCGGYMLGIEYRHTKERARNDAGIFVNKSSTTGR